MSAATIVPARPATEAADSEDRATPRPDRRRGALKVTLVVAFYALLTVIFFRPVVLHDQHLSTVPMLEQYYYPWRADHQFGIPFTPQTDEGQTFYPRQVFVDRVVHDGELPTWDPYTFAGHPYLSNGATTFFYPVRQLVTWLADPALAHDLYLMLHMFGAGLALYFLCRELRISTPSALLAGVAWMWSPIFLAWIQLELTLAIIVWLPVALALVHRAHRTRSWRALGGAALCLGLMLNGGTLDQASGAVALVGLYGSFLELADLWKTRAGPSLWPRTRRAFGRLVALGGLGVGIGMITYLPFALLSQRVARTPIPYDVFIRELNVPFDQFGRVFWPIDAPLSMSGMHRLTFAGTLVAILAIIGLFTRRSGSGLGRGLLVGSVVLFAYTPLTRVIDGLSSQYRYISPGRFLWAWVLGLIVLAALGLDVVLGWIVGHRLAPGEEPIPHVELQWRKPTGRQAGAALLVAVVLAGTGGQLYRYGHLANVTFTPRTADYLYPTTPLIQHLQARDAAPAGDRSLPIDTEGYAPPLDSSLPMIYPFESAAGYDSALPSWVADLWRVVGGKDPGFVSTHPLSQGLSAIFFAANTRYDLLPRLGITSVITSPDVAKEGPGWDAAGLATRGLKPDYSGVDGKTFTVDGAAPRAYVVHATETETSQAAGLARFTDPTFPWRSTVLLPSGTTPSAGTTSATELEPATVETHDLDRVRLKVHSTGAGWLVLLDSFDEGWTATVNGKSVSVRRANTSFRAVPVPDGDSVVEFHYTTPGLAVGAGITLVSLLIVAVLVATPAVRRRRRHDSVVPSA